jgi:hypothetical protein
MIPMIAEKLLDETAHTVALGAGDDSAAKGQHADTLHFLVVDGQLHIDYLLCPVS